MGTLVVEKEGSPVELTIAMESVWLLTSATGQEYVVTLEEEAYRLVKVMPGASIREVKVLNCNAIEEALEEEEEFLFLPDDGYYNDVED